MQSVIQAGQETRGSTSCSYSGRAFIILIWSKKGAKIYLIEFMTDHKKDNNKEHLNQLDDDPLAFMDNTF